MGLWECLVEALRSENVCSIVDEGGQATDTSGSDLLSGSQSMGGVALG
jgi:hypothetical protein